MAILTKLQWLYEVKKTGNLNVENQYNALLNDNSSEPNGDSNRQKRKK